MLKKTFQLSTETTTYPVVRDWYDLDDEQIEACYAQGYDEDHSLFGLLMVLPSHLRATYTLYRVSSSASVITHYITYGYYLPR